MPRTETELKLSLTKKALDRFRRRSSLPKHTVGKPQTRKLTSVYFDTPDLKLYKSGISLRVRQNGKKRLLTVKTGGRIKNGLSKRREFEREVKKKKPNLNQIKDKALRQQLAKLIKGNPLKPVFETIIWRTIRTINMPGNGVVELALDHGEIKSGNKRCSIQEVEIEQKSGSPKALLNAAKTFFSDDPIIVSKQSKAEQGYSLYLGNEDDALIPVQPVKGGVPELSTSMSVEQALCEVGQQACEQILSNWQSVLTTQNPEGAHQMRIGLRRLRTALKVFKPAVRKSHTNLIRTQARDLARIVGRLRDADVLLLDIYTRAEKDLFKDDGEAGLAKLLKSNIKRQRHDVQAELQDSRWTEFKLDCIMFDTAVANAGKKNRKSDTHYLVELARNSLEQCWNAVARSGQRIDKLSITERHDMRKDLKALRYATEYFHLFYNSDESNQFLKLLKQLQEVFGYLNDVELTGTLPDIVVKHAPDNKKLLKDARDVVAWHKTHADDAWDKAKQRWKRLAQLRKFWLDDPRS